MSTVLSLLGQSIGPTVAKAVLDRLRSVRGVDSKLQRVLEATEKGVSIIQALRGEFGDHYLKALAESMGKKSAPRWSYEAGTRDYIGLDLPSQDQIGAIGILRDELNINLDRLSVHFESGSNEKLRNHFRGMFSVWQERYTHVFGESKDDVSIFQAIDDLLGGDKRTFKDVLEILSRTSLGGVGALMVISGVLLSMGIGAGILAKISIFLVGIPWVNVGVLVIPGVILVALAKYNFNDKHAMTTCISMAYKLLERRHKKIAKGKSK